MQIGSITKVSAAIVVLLLCGACSQGPPKSPVIGEAFVGPATLKIRSDFPLQSAAVATVQHGDRLQILQVRRKFIRVRTSRGAEGWTDERQLLAAADMQALRELASRAAQMPSQGSATTYAILNIHSQPALASPSFLQLKPNERLDVLRSDLFPRNEAPPRTPLIPPAPKKKKAPPRKAKEKKTPTVPPPPMPKPPAPPSDWLDLSRTDSGDDEEPDSAKAVEKPPVKIDLWSLVRTPQGQAGWVLTRMLSMAIPDEVAQYAEGHRIVSYFPLGSTEDGDQKKTIWLWTTTRDSRAPWDFDSFRVFTWSIRRHRYETAHIERDIQGYSPVLVNDSGFSICMEKKDGQRMRRQFTLTGNSVRFASEQPCEAPLPPLEVKSPAPLPVNGSAAPPKENLWQRLKHRFGGK